MSISTPLSSSDVIVGSAFGLLALFLVALRAHRISESRILLAALIVKLVASLVYGSIAVYYYRGLVDSIWYHNLGVEYARVIRSDLASGSHRYLSMDPFFSPGGYSTSRIISFSGLVHFLTMESFLATSFAFALIGFAGQVLLYRTFVAQFPEPRLRWWWRLGLLFFPSLTFWSAGILKEPLGLWGVGSAVWGIHYLLKQQRLRYLAVTLFGLYTLFLFRPQLLPVTLICLAPWVILDRRANRALVSNGGMRRSFTPLLRVGIVFAVLGGLLVVWKVLPTYSLTALPATLVGSSTIYEQINAGTPITYDATWIGLIKAAPVAMVLTLYRPFLWEGSGMLMLVSAVENLVLLLLSLRALVILIRERSTLSVAVRSPMFLSCLAFVILFGFAVGLSTPNLGSISRYRVPLIPFLVGTLTIIEHSRRRRTVRRTVRSQVPVVIRDAPVV